MPRTPHSSLNRRRHSPRRVPPLQSCTRSLGLLEGEVGVAAVQLLGDAGEPGAERERLDPLTTGDRGVDESQHRPGVRLHRTADVEQQHQAAQAIAGLAPVPADRLTTGPDRAAQRLAQVRRPLAR